MWWRRPLFVVVIVLVAIAVVALLARRGASFFEDDFDDHAATQAGWRIVSGEGGAGTVADRSAFRLAGEAPDGCAVAIADQGRVYGVDNLTVQADIRVESGVGGILFGLQQPDGLISYRVEVDPATHRISLWERNPDGTDIDFDSYRDTRIDTGAWCRLTLAVTETQFIGLLAFDDTQPKEVMRNSQRPPEHTHRQAFDDGQVGLYALGGTTWFDNVRIKGPLAGDSEESAVQ